MVNICVGMVSLNQLRKKIDKIDSEILELFKKRLNIVEKIAEVKRLSGLKITDKKREREMIEKRKKIGEREGIEKMLVEELFKKIISLSKKHMRKVYKKQDR